MKEKNNKLIVIVNTIAIFFAMFLFSFMYEWFPNFLTAAIFPVNESLFEHLKLMFSSTMIVSLIVFFIFKLKHIKINNYFLGLFLSTLLQIVLYFIVYIPLYNHFGENLVIAMGLYLIVLIISEYSFYLIMTKIKNNDLYNAISTILLSISFFVLVYLTFNPRINDFFFDPIEEKYGINIYT